MAHKRIHVRDGLVAAATAIAVLTVTPPAQAGPPSPSCTQYAFNGEYPIRGANGWNVYFTSTGQVPGGPARVQFDDGGIVHGTVAEGEISGRNVRFVIKWNNRPDNEWIFDGVVGDDGLVRRGGETKRPEYYGEGIISSLWDSVNPLDCIAPAVSDNTRVKPKPPVSASDLAPPPEDVPVTKTATVTNDVDVYDAPGGSGKVTGILRRGSTVQLLGSCTPNSWCQVSGGAVPRGNGWVWGQYLQY